MEEERSTANHPVEELVPSVTPVSPCCTDFAHLAHLAHRAGVARLDAAGGGTGLETGGGSRVP